MSSDSVASSKTTSNKYCKSENLLSQPVKMDIKRNGLWMQMLRTTAPINNRSYPYFSMEIVKSLSTYTPNYWNPWRQYINDTFAAVICIITQIKLSHQCCIIITRVLSVLSVFNLSDQSQRCCYGSKLQEEFLSFDNWQSDSLLTTEHATVF